MFTTILDILYQKIRSWLFIIFWCRKNGENISWYFKYNSSLMKSSKNQIFIKNMKYISTYIPEKTLPDQAYTIKNLQGHFENIHRQRVSEGKIYWSHHSDDFLMIQIIHPLKCWKGQRSIRMHSRKDLQEDCWSYYTKDSYQVWELMKKSCKNAPIESLQNWYDQDDRSTRIHGAYHHSRNNIPRHPEGCRDEYIRVVRHSIQHSREIGQIMKICTQIIDYRVEWIQKYEPLNSYQHPNQRQKDHRAYLYNIIRVYCLSLLHPHSYWYTALHYCWMGKKVLVKHLIRMIQSMKQVK